MVTVLDRPEARYHYKQIIDYKDAKGIHNEELVTLKIERAGEIVVDAQTGETIGRNLFYKRRPGWVDSLWVGFFGSGLTICPDPEKELRQPPFPGAVFIPTSK